jgi:hypothetical protein
MRKIKYNLDNLVRRLRTTEKRGIGRIAEIWQFVLGPYQTARENPSWAEAQEKVRPQLLPATFLSRLPGPIVHQPFPLHQDLVVGLVLDLPDTMLYVPTAWLEEWSIAADLAMARAIENLRRDVASSPLGNSLNSGLTAGKYVATDRPAYYAATRIILPEEQELVRQLLGPHPVCAVPNREFLVCWSADYDKDIPARAKARRDFERYPHPISPDPFVLPGS